MTNRFSAAKIHTLGPSLVIFEPRLINNGLVLVGDRMDVREKDPVSNRKPLLNRPSAYPQRKSQ